MLISRMIEVKDNNPTGAVQAFLDGLLAEGIADRLFAQVELTPGEALQSQVIAAAGASVNPFLPLMLENAAVALQLAMQAEPDKTFAAALRPCEVRSVIELSKRNVIDLKRLVLIGVDCLGTYDEAFYQEASANHPDDPYYLMNEALRFAEKGQIAPYRYRTACQFCDRPAADLTAVDIILGVIGLDAGQHLLVLADEADDAHLKLQKLTDRVATERETVQREVTVWKLSERRAKNAGRKLESLGLQDANLGVIMGYMSKCTLCGDCLDVCPLCADEELSVALREGKTNFAAAFIKQSQRLTSCSSCGMCDTHCPEDIPLCAITHSLSRPLQERMGYTPGRNADDPLPWES